MNIVKYDIEKKCKVDDICNWKNIEYIEFLIKIMGYISDNCSTPKPTCICKQILDQYDDQSVKYQRKKRKVHMKRISRKRKRNRRRKF